MFLRNLILALARNKAIERFVRNSRITRGVVRRFIAGDTLEEALVVAEDLAGRGFKVSLDLLGEHVATEAEADSALEEYLRLVSAIAASPHFGGWMPERINISIKLSQLGAHLDETRCANRLEMLLTAASAHPIFIRIDMEESAMTDLTIRLLLDAHRRHHNVGTVLQAMLFRTPADIEELIKQNVRVRIVKGAYLEPESVAYQKKKDVDDAYFACSCKLIRDGVFPAIATHDARIIRRIENFVETEGISPGRFEYQMLYGIRRGLQEQLKKKGRIVRVYVPYGSSWYPYFTRRLAERPANLLFFIRSLFSR
jgi:proline dehydrogenase